MPDFPVLRNVDRFILSPGSPHSLGNELLATATTRGLSTWVVANKAYFIPISIFAPITIKKMFVENGTTVSGNIDVGIYDAGGVKKVSIGSTAQAGVSAIQEFDITDTLLNPGLYYLAGAMDNTTGIVQRAGPSSAVLRTFGVFEQTSAFPLPSTATFALLSSSFFPYVFATQKATI